MVVHQYVGAYVLVNGLIAKNAKLIVRLKVDGTQFKKKKIENMAYH